jgi:hypothetical protein
VRKVHASPFPLKAVFEHHFRDHFSGLTFMQAADEVLLCTAGPYMGLLIHGDFAIKTLEMQLKPEAAMTKEALPGVHAWMVSSPQGPALGVLDSTLIVLATDRPTVREIAARRNGQKAALAAPGPLAARLDKSKHLSAVFRDSTGLLRAGKAPAEQIKSLQSWQEMIEYCSFSVQFDAKYRVRATIVFKKAADVENADKFLKELKSAKGAAKEAKTDFDRMLMTAVNESLRWEIQGRTLSAEIAIHESFTQYINRAVLEGPKDKSAQPK